MVHFKEKYTLWEDSFTASYELCRNKDVKILDFVHRVTGLEKKIVENEKIIGQKDKIIVVLCLPGRALGPFLCDVLYHKLILS